jgi:hypothetical protein
MQTYKVNDFVKLLSEDRLKDRLSIYCMVKTDEDRKDILLISPSGSCDKWIPIPHDAIESIDYLQMTGCKDHQHPFVQLNLKDPPKDNHIAHLYLELFKTAEANITAVRNEASSRQGLIARPGPDQDICLRPYFGPCEQQPDGSYSYLEKSSGTGCKLLRLTCVPELNPIISLEDSGVRIFVSGVGFSPNGRVELIWNYLTESGSRASGYSNSNSDENNNSIPRVADVRGEFRNSDIEARQGTKDYIIYAVDLQTGSKSNVIRTRLF